MPYRNKFDFTGKHSSEGARAEQVFKDLIDQFFDSDIMATDLQGQIRHIDFEGYLPIKVDVKSVKDPDIIWIELKNVQGRAGWLLGEATHLAFERPYHFVIVKREHLKDLVYDIVDFTEEVESAKDCLYNMYTRHKWGRKDLLTKIKPADLKRIPHLVISKYETSTD